MTTKHTPTPWVVSEPNGRGNGYRISGCEAWLGYDRYSEETKANAELIARAPLLLEENKQKQEIIDALLEALQNLLDANSKGTMWAVAEATSKANDAIAKAIT